VAVSPAAFLTLGLIAMRVTGKPMPAVGDFGRFSGTPAIGLVGVFLLITLVGSLGEETRWRGYALPQLQRRFSPLTATVILAPLWFLWHLPQFAVIGTYRDLGPTAYVGMFRGLTCGAIVLTWLYNRSGGSILLVIVWHGVYNFVGATQAATGTLAAIVSTLIMVQGIILVVLELRARRRGPPSVLGPPWAAAGPSELAREVVTVKARLESAGQAVVATEASWRGYRLFPASSTGTALNGAMVIVVNADGAVLQVVPLQGDQLPLSVPLLP
jgi:membrane protease YdiL (CAAX protease family)